MFHTNPQSLSDLFGVFSRLEGGESVALVPEGWTGEVLPVPDEGRVWLGVTSSGSTGTPKLVWKDWERMRDGASRSAAVRGWCWAAPYDPWSYAGVQVAVQAWVGGGEVVSLRGDWPEMWRRLGDEHVDALSCTPTFADLLIQNEPEGGSGWSPKQITLGGEPLRERTGSRLRARWPEARILAIYAAAEFGVLLKTERVDGWYEVGVSSGWESPEPSGARWTNAERLPRRGSAGGPDQSRTQNPEERTEAQRRWPHNIAFRSPAANGQMQSVCPGGVRSAGRINPEERREERRKKMDNEPGKPAGRRCSLTGGTPVLLGLRTDDATHGDVHPPIHDLRSTIYDPRSPIGNLRSGVLEVSRDGVVWRSTGDRVVVDVDAGLIRVVGRADDVANVGGTKVSLAEVAAAAEEVPGVRRAVAVAVDNPVTGQVVALRYAVEDGFDEGEVRERLEKDLRETLPKPAWPRDWRVDEVGMGRNAKRGVG